MEKGPFPARWPQRKKSPGLSKVGQTVAAAHSCPRCPCAGRSMRGGPLATIRAGADPQSTAVDVQVEGTDNNLCSWLSPVGPSPPLPTEVQHLLCLERPWGHQERPGLNGATSTAFPPPGGCSRSLLQGLPKQLASARATSVSPLCRCRASPGLAAQPQVIPRYLPSLG